MHQRHVSWRSRWLAASPREQLNITVESFCVGNTITSLENRMYRPTGTNTSSGIVFKHVDFKRISPHVSRHTFVSKALLCFPLAVIATSLLFWRKEGYHKSQQNIHLKHGMSFSVIRSNQSNDSTDMNPTPSLFLRVKAESEKTKKISDPKGPNDIILTFHWTLKTFPLQQWGHKEGSRIEQVSWTNMPWNRK